MDTTPPGLSASTPSSTPNQGSLFLAATVLAAAVFLGLHLPFVAWATDDIDATNFMLALRQFDVREHQPHPPGYPVFIAMGHVARGMLTTLGPVTGPPSPDALDINALAICSAVFGALAVFPMVLLWTAMGGDRSRAWLAAVLAMATPVFSYTAIRPLSDLPGLAFAMAGVALLVGEVAVGAERCSMARLLGGAALAGVAAGVRSQTLWLTVPAVAIAAAVALWRRDVRSTVAIGVGLVGGVLAWAVPLTIVLGGWRQYLDVLMAQAADDFRGAIFAVDLAPRTLGLGLYSTFVRPWNSVPLAVVVLGLAAVGGMRLLVTRRREALVLAAVFGPYLLLHLLFHDTNHTRYAIPLLPPLTYMAMCGLQPSTRPRWAAGVAIILVAASMSVGPVIAQARVGSPAVRALRDIQEALLAAETPPVIAMHHAVQRQLRFATFAPPVLATPLRYEWLAVVDHFRAGAEAPVWFLASRRRSDLALFDPAAMRTIQEYGWTFEPDSVLGGARPRAITWYEISRPGWMAGEGWALTPETRGVAERADRSPSHGTSIAYVARRPEPTVLMIGGRNLGGPCRTAARLVATLDGRAIGEWQLPAGEPFLQFVDLPAGALAGARGFAELRLQASDLSGAGLGVDVSLEQFDVQSGRRPVTGLAQGWYEPELEPDSGERWRWARQRAIVQVSNFGRDVVLGLKAADPMRTMGRAVQLQVRGAGRVLATRRFDTDVDWEVPISAELIEQARGRLTIMSDGSFVPDQTQRNGDHRELAVRVLEIDVEFGDRRPGGL